MQKIVYIVLIVTEFLLTRGRDGFIIFVPEELPFVYEVLVEAGMEIL